MRLIQSALILLDMTRKSTGEVDLESFRTLPSFRLHVLARLSERMHEQHYKRRFGLNLRECRVIGITGGHGDPSFRRICQESNLDKAHVSRLINRLIERKLLSKENDPSDQRTVRVTLTERGRRVHRALHAAATALNEAWLAPLSASQRTSFLAALDQLTERTRLITGEQSAAERTSGKRTLSRQPGASAARRRGRQIVLNHDVARELLEVLNAALRKSA
jgi:DNA-binding MarR family transcriptional regulator